MLPLLILLLLLAALCGVLILRALRFRGKPPEPVAAEDVPVDADLAVERLRAMLRVRTVSRLGEAPGPEFAAFRALIRQLYPAVFETCRTELVGDTGLLLRWQGREDGPPAVFLSHYDVVPAEEPGWPHPPFDAVLEDGVLWGRGALDMKNQLCAVLEAMEYLILRGFRPERDIYFAMSGQEEIMGPDAARIRDLLRDRGIRPRFVVDEGGDVMENVFPGAKVTCAMVGVGEKGVGNLYFTARSAGGHASVPTEDNPLPRLCHAMERIGTEPFPQRSTPALERMVDTLGRYCPFRTRLLLANRDLLRPLYFRWLRKQGGMLYAGSRTTFALTRARGSQAGNVIPPEAEFFANLRMLYGDTTASVTEALKRRMDDPSIEITCTPGSEPRPDSLCTEGWEELTRAIRESFPGAVVTPYLMVGGTDSRHYRDICDNVYRFSAKAVTGAEKATVHGVGERIRVENTRRAAQFFVRLMARC